MGFVQMEARFVTGKTILANSFFVPYTEDIRPLGIDCVLRHLPDSTVLRRMCEYVRKVV